MDQNYYIPQPFIDDFWLYSKLHCELFNSINTLIANEEYYSAVLLLFNVIELILKTFRGKDSDTFEQDINDLYSKDLLTEIEKNYLNDKDTGIRKIRNRMCHKDFYKCFIEIDGIAYSLAEMNTWQELYNKIAPNVIAIISNILSKWRCSF